MDESRFKLVGLTPVRDLAARYKLTRSVIYKRMKDLGISPRKIGVKAYINDDQLALLDAHHEFIQGGGTTAEFLFFREQDVDDSDSGDP